jgi:hypothetical protein
MVNISIERLSSKMSVSCQPAVCINQELQYSAQRQQALHLVSTARLTNEAHDGRLVRPKQRDNQPVCENIKIIRKKLRKSVGTEETQLRVHADKAVKGYKYVNAALGCNVLRKQLVKKKPVSECPQLKLPVELYRQASAVDHRGRRHLLSVHVDPWRAALPRYLPTLWIRRQVHRRKMASSLPSPCQCEAETRTFWSSTGSGVCWRICGRARSGQRFHIIFRTFQRTLCQCGRDAEQGL